MMDKKTRLAGVCLAPGKKKKKQGSEENWLLSLSLQWKDEGNNDPALLRRVHLKDQRKVHQVTAKEISFMQKEKKKRKHHENC